MRDIEIRAQRLTETAWFLARENGAEIYEKKAAVEQECDCCHKSRGIFYCYFDIDGNAICIFCEVLKLFKSSSPN